MGSFLMCVHPLQIIGSVVLDGRGEAGILVQLPVRLAQPQGNGAWRTVANGCSVHLRYRYDPPRRASQEYLVRAPHLLCLDLPGFEREAAPCRELDCRLARDALEDASTRGSDSCVLHGEDVEPGSLDDVLCAVNQYDGLPAALVRLVEAELQIQPVIVLHRRVHGLGPYSLH